MGAGEFIGCTRAEGQKHKKEKGETRQYRDGSWGVYRVRELFIQFLGGFVQYISTVGTNLTILRVVVKGYSSM